MANMFPDVKGVDDLDNMLQQKKLSGHPRIIVNTLQDAVESLNDAGLFVSKMEYVGSLMVEFAISTEQLKVCLKYSLAIGYFFGGYGG